MVAVVWPLDPSGLSDLQLSNGPTCGSDYNGVIQRVRLDVDPIQATLVREDLDKRASVGGIRVIQSAP